MSAKRVKQIKRQWQLVKLTEGAMLSAGCAMLFYGLAGQLLWIALLLFMLALIAWGIVIGFWSVRQKDIWQYLNKAYPQLQHSMELVGRDQYQLNIIENLQRAEVEKQLGELSVRFPWHWRWPASIFIFGLLVMVIYSTLDSQLTEKMARSKSQMLQSSLSMEQAPEIKNIKIAIRPPAYSGLKSIQQSSTIIEALEGSTISWSVIFNQPIDRCEIIFTNDKSFEMTGEFEFHYTSSFFSNEFYHFQYDTKDSVFTSDLYPLKVIRDQNPIIDMGELELFQQHEFGDISVLEIQVNITDDYGIDRANIVATVAKGSGESVKFREQILDFESSIRKGRKELELKKKFDFEDLELEPGDELYFYVIAQDNKVPIPNISKSETYIISLLDTADAEFYMQGNLGADLMPAYFRSQRQIIMDTEKLLTNQSNISDEEFQSKSNELGFDQKVLRLRYGQFLGEEFVSDAGAGDAEVDHVDDSENDEENLLEKYVHNHDSENEQNLLEEENPLEAYMHNHDMAEENTFFFKSVRAKLKAAMALMWESELHLRLYQAKQSLPYQYKALRLIKEIKNHSRIYVQRMGFDPTPLKPIASRFKGKAMEDVVNSRASNRFDEQDEFLYTKNLLKAINDYQVNGSAIDSLSWQRAGDEIALKGLEVPLKYFAALQSVQRFSNGVITPSKYDMEIEALNEQLYGLIPKETKSVLSMHRKSKWNNALVEQLNQQP